jgi:methyl-accepting chemotaxis protein
MSQMDQVTQRNASASEELSSTAEEMASQAEALQQLVAFFRVQDAMGAALRPTPLHAHLEAAHPGDGPRAPKLRAPEPRSTRGHALAKPSLDANYKRF